MLRLADCSTTKATGLGCHQVKKQLLYLLYLLDVVCCICCVCCKYYGIGLPPIKNSHNCCICCICCIFYVVCCICCICWKGYGIGLSPSKNSHNRLFFKMMHVSLWLVIVKMMLLMLFTLRYSWHYQVEPLLRGAIKKGKFRIILNLWDCPRLQRLHNCPWIMIIMMMTVIMIKKEKSQQINKFCWQWQQWLFWRREILLNYKDLKKFNILAITTMMHIIVLKTWDCPWLQRLHNCDSQQDDDNSLLYYNCDFDVDKKSLHR